MNLFVTIMMFGWIPILFLLFSQMPPRRAVIVGFLCAWLFLPVAEFKLPGLPPYNKISATCVGVLLAVGIFDSRRFTAFRFHKLDLPMLVWCLVPIASSMTNGLGIYDGLSASFRQTVTWGLPYLIGRMYFTDLESFRDLAVGIFVGGLAYIPLCLFEIRMSPQLHYLVYGDHAHAFGQTVRFGGWRPTVFMAHGLMVGWWMATASLVGVWLWYGGMVRRLRNVPMAWLVIPLLITTVLCKSLGALILLTLGLVGFYATRYLRFSLVMILVALIPIGYVTARLAKNWAGGPLVSLAASINQDRAESLRFRLENESLLAEKALKRPIFGWGGWGRSRVFDAETGEDISITDGFWIIALGMHGLVGLGAIFIVQLLPAVLLARWLRTSLWCNPALAAPTVLATLLPLYLIDNLFNAMINPIFMLVAGGLGSLVSQRILEPTRVGPPRERPPSVRRPPLRRSCTVPIRGTVHRGGR